MESGSDKMKINDAQLNNADEFKGEIPQHNEHKWKQGLLKLCKSAPAACVLQVEQFVRSLLSH